MNKFFNSNIKNLPTEEKLCEVFPFLKESLLESSYLEPYAIDICNDKVIFKNGEEISMVNVVFYDRIRSEIYLSYASIYLERIIK